MEELSRDPWLVSLLGQVVASVLSGLIVQFITASRSGVSPEEIRRLFRRQDLVVPSTPRLALVINWRYLLFYAVILSGIMGLTLLQDVRTINWFRIGLYVILVTWWCTVALNAFVLLDGADIEGPLPNMVSLFLMIIFPFVGHTKSLGYTLFTFVTKAGLGILLYGVLTRFTDLTARPVMAGLLIAFALIDTSFYAYLFLAQTPEFRNWRQGRFVVSELSRYGR